MSFSVVRCLRNFTTRTLRDEINGRHKDLPRLSRYLLSAKKPAFQDDSTKGFLLLRDYGLIDVSTSGFNILLPLCSRALDKLITLIDEEMSAIGGQKFVFPSLAPIELLELSGKWESHQKEFLNLKDRQGRRLYLAPTHEEIITRWLSGEKLSQKKLPLYIYQIGEKFRDEKRPRSGLLRSKEFIMKDLYSFDVNLEKANDSYELVSRSYQRLFKKLELPIYKVVADPGSIGGHKSHEYHLLSCSGEDKIYICEKCRCGISEEYKLNYNENVENCSHCGNKLEERLSLELGHTFLLGTRYTKPFSCFYRTDKNDFRLLEMSCYGLGVSRILAACLEKGSSDRFLDWPRAIAPYFLSIITPKAGSKEEILNAHLLAEDVASYLSQSLSLDVIIDDRNELTIGQRVFENKCWGFPFLLIFGKKSVQDIPIFELLDAKSGVLHELTHCELIKTLSSASETLNMD